MLTLAFLGGFQAHLDGRPLTHFRSANTQALLAYLALQPGRVFPRESLAALLWPEESESVARNNLRQSLHTLRTLVGDQERPNAPYLAATRETIAFTHTGAWRLDVADFLAAIEARDLETAVAAYAGDLLAGFTNDSLPFEAWLRQEREALHHLALEALTEIAADSLAAGQPEKARVLAQQQLALEPWRESAHRQLMLAFALAGDRANALAQYERCRTVLAEELGVEPEAETTGLYDDIKAGRVGARQSAERIQPPPSRRHNLPAPTTPLIGRETDLERIEQLFAGEQQRLVTIGGPGGMGKTRLAQAAGLHLLGSQFDEVYLVDLAPVEEAEAIAGTIAAALNYRAPDAARDLFPQLLEGIGARRLLLILDSFEHLLPAAGLVNELLRACPETAVVITSRQWLNLAGENHYELGGLEYPDGRQEQEAASYTAVQLFVDSACRVQPSFALDAANRTAVVRICRLVEGMPLGQLLAAAWLNLLTPEEIAAEIENSLDFLAADLRDLPLRQRSVRAVFERSWAMLGADEQAVLARLSIFRGGFTREAAGEVADANLRHLLALVNKSLLQRDAGSGRFVMHDLLRQFAGEKRRERSEQIGLRHCRYFAGIAAKAFRQSLGLYPRQLPTKLPEEKANFQRAWEFALDNRLANELLELTRALQAYNFVLGIVESLETRAIEALQEHGLTNDDPVVLQLRTNFVNLLRDHTVIRQHYEELQPLVEKSADPEVRFWLYEQMAEFELSIYSGGLKSQQASKWIDKGVEHFRSSGEAVLSRRADAHAMWVRAILGLWDELDPDTMQDSLSYFEQNYPDSYVVFGLLASLAFYYSRRLKAYDEAIYYASRCLNVAIGWQDLGPISGAETDLTHIYLQMGRTDRAAYQVLDCLEWHLSIGAAWQTLGLLQGTTIQFPDLIGGRELAVSVMSMIYHHPKAVMSYLQEIELARSEFQDEMGAEAYEEAWQKGLALEFETAVAGVRAGLEATASGVEGSA